MRNNNKLPTPPSLVESSNYRFLIFDAPNDDNLPVYIAELKKHNVHHLVRACDPTYSVDPLRAIGISVHEMPFPDGGVPPKNVVDKWLSLLETVCKEDEIETIGVHCIAGLGRAPVLVAIALIEGGMDPLKAILYVRERRGGSINMKQMTWLKGYKPRLQKKGKAPCIIM